MIAAGVFYKGIEGAARATFCIRSWSCCRCATSSSSALRPSTLGRVVAAATGDCLGRHVRGYEATGHRLGAPQHMDRPASPGGVALIGALVFTGCIACLRLAGRPEGAGEGAAAPRRATARAIAGAPVVMTRVVDTALYVARGCGLFALARSLTANRLRILCYHGASLDDESEFEPMLFMRAATFPEDRLDRLLRTGHPVLPLWRGARTPPQGNTAACGGGDHDRRRLVRHAERDGPRPRPPRTTCDPVPRHVLC